MFLRELNQEEKEAFLELAYLIAKIDKNQSIFENSILNKFKAEMGIDKYSIKGSDIEDILKVFENDRTKNIVLVEILRLIFSDGVFHDFERESIQLIKKHFGFNKDDFQSLRDWVIKIKELEK
ncbi:hypothetical protein B4102_1181 [Heyndrickxia sporothermodurans]|uniref:Co-chaperone DjlA N-terminal domain-containing protein n=1 Tax=Heyndrickxia sporothermodurans TaxID=46224 RepID=A0A150KPM9_9BACI|nr:hypothetical protein [Heyndrickxia sporothermodurans]KYD00169.1 hypothetical protein B4102_1181 [Heyndrickxia sporothermodurans]